MVAKKVEEPEEVARPDEKLPTPQNNVGYHAKATVGEEATLTQDAGYWKNAPDVLARHLKETGGKWQTRFPPEPNVSKRRDPHRHLIIPGISLER